MTRVVHYTIGGDLVHHGIKGQKWGKRNGPPYPLNASDHSTAEKKAGTKGWSKEAKQESKKKTTSTSSGNLQRLKDNVKKTEKEYKKLYKTKKNSLALYSEDYDILDERLQKAERNFYLARKELEYAKTKEALKTESSKKSKRRLKLEEAYKKQGMSDEEASVYAARRVQIEKYVAIAGATALTAAVGYAAYKNYQMSTDGFLNENDIMYRIAQTDSTKLHDSFYTSNKKDSHKYVGKYAAEHLKGMTGTKDIYQKTIRPTKSVKIASEKNAAKIFGETLRNDSKFAAAVKNLKNVEAVHDLYGDLDSEINAVIKGKNPLSLYKKFNTSITFNDVKTNDDVMSPFIEAVKKSGYGAVYDYNDRWHSGYQSKSSTIGLDSASFVVDSVRQVPISEMKSENDAYSRKVVSQALGITVASLAVGGTAYKKTKQAISDIKQQKKDKEIVQEYKQEHPNSKLTYNEILKLYQD